MYVYLTCGHKDMVSYKKTTKVILMAEFAPLPSRSLTTGFFLELEKSSVRKKMSSDDDDNDE